MQPTSRAALHLALLFDQSAGVLQFSAGEFSTATVEGWQRDVRRLTSGDNHAEALFFIDNNPAKDALVRGVSSSHASSVIVKTVRKTCASLAIAAWYDRVPSPSNIADAPSRLDFSVLIGLGAIQVLPLSLPDLGISVK